MAKATNHYHPRYWPTWFLIGLMRLAALLPFRTQLALGRFLGRLTYRFGRYRRYITEVNLHLCFPTLTPQQHQQLTKRCFESTGMGLMEGIMAWWMPDKYLENRVVFRGMEHIEKVLSEDYSVLLAGAHYTCMELVGRLCAMRYQFSPMYRKHGNPVFNKIMTDKRKRYFHNIISRRDMRSFIRHIKNQEPIWYAADQDYGPKHSVFSPFFGIETATITTLLRLCRNYQCAIVPVFYHRLDNNQGYEVVFAEPIVPDDNLTEEQYAERINQALEKDLREYPDQYFWQHRRFKTVPDGTTRRYISQKFF